MEIAKIIRHSEFNKTGHTEYDIAVLKLKNKITFNDKVRPICLPTKRFLDGKICWATGWGHAKPRKIGEQPVGSTTLKQAREKALHAFYKVTRIVDFRKLQPEQANKLFTSLISPILTYASELTRKLDNKASFTYV
ncbi:Transmembrane protease serine 3 [Exaiptasia diaphana]|nr:Transmembrane protease serine 3 [Exaiptasia diaphana]